MAFPKIIYITPSANLWHCFYENIWDGEEFEFKEREYGNDYPDVFWACALVRTFLCTCSVCEGESWGLVLWLELGHFDYYRDAVLRPLQNPARTFSFSKHIAALVGWVNVGRALLRIAGFECERGGYCMNWSLFMMEFFSTLQNVLARLIVLSDILRSYDLD